MKAFGAVFRWFLSINAIWGLMIIIAFVLTVWQHYMPRTSVIDQSLLHDGQNQLVITVTDKEKQKHTTEFQIAFANGALVIPDTAKSRQPDKSYLVSSSMRKGGTKLVWDSLTSGSKPLAGAFVIEVNGRPCAKGDLVTLQSLTDAAFDYGKKAFDIGIGLVSTMVLFLGLMKVGEAAGIVQVAAKVFRPVIRFLFPDVPPDHPANGAILMNITTSVLGLGNAATPFGLKAMMELQNLNPHKSIASNSMIMFLGWNTAGLALLPTTLIAVRKAAGCSNPFEIIAPCILACLIATMVAIIAVKLLGMVPFFSIESALAEEQRELEAAGPKKADEEAKQ
jgi:spore maturation protein A